MKTSTSTSVKNHWTFCHCHTAKTARGKSQGLGHHRNCAAICEKPRPSMGEHLDVVSKLKSLGIQLRCARRMTNDVAEERVRKGITCLQTHSLGTSAASNESHLDCVFGWTCSHVWLPCWGLSPQTDKFAANSGGRSTVEHEKRRSRCREIVLTLFVTGHLVDPLQNAAYQSLKTVETHG